jgi:hypothetical protein
MPLVPELNVVLKTRFQFPTQKSEPIPVRFWVSETSGSNWPNWVTAQHLVRTSTIVGIDVGGKVQPKLVKLIKSSNKYSNSEKIGVHCSSSSSPPPPLLLLQVKYLVGIEL